MAGVPTNDAFYGIEHKKIVRTITNDIRNTPSNTGGTLYCHKVVFLDGYEGEFFQKTATLKHKGGADVISGEEICFTAKQKADIKDPDTLKICESIPQQVSKAKDNDEEFKAHTQEPVKVFGTASAFAVAYAKDIANEKYKGRDVTVEEYLNFIGPMTAGLKKIMMDNL